MKVQNVFGVLGVAAATMAFTLMVFAPWSSGISEEAKSIKPRILQPTFASHGCKFVLKTEKPAYQAGESPAVEVTAANPTDKAVEATVWESILAAEVPSPFSRVLAIPRPTWSKAWSVSLKPGETTTTRLAANVKLTAKQNIMIALSDKERVVMVEELPMRRNTPLMKAAVK